MGVEKSVQEDRGDVASTICGFDPDRLDATITNEGRGDDTPVALGYPEDPLIDRRPNCLVQRSGTDLRAPELLKEGLAPANTPRSREHGVDEVFEGVIARRATNDELHGMFSHGYDASLDAVATEGLLGVG